MDKILSRVCSRTGFGERAVSAVIEMLDEGATVPFISRYRKERTGNMDEVGVRAVEQALAQSRALEERRQFVEEAIAAAGALTDELKHRLAEADTLTEIEDLYAPYKPKRRTRATMAREKGLEPLAKQIMSGRLADCRQAAQRFVKKDGAADVDEAIAGASDIIAEWVAESARLRDIVRKDLRRAGVLKCKVSKDKAAEIESSVYAQYADREFAVRRLSSHQYLAIRRAEREGFLKVKIEAEDGERLEDRVIGFFMPRTVTDSCEKIIAGAVADGLKRLLLPSVENDIDSELKDNADKVAVDIFADNLRQLFMASPLPGRCVLAIDPGFRTGCKVAVLDRQGKLLDHSTIYPTAPRCDEAGAAKILSSFKEKYGVDAIAIGSGTASRETERFVLGLGLLPRADVYIVNEDGASVYSASDVARAEFPDEDVTVRGTVSIGRRLQDPMAELVKIEPKSIGVGQYQHDVDQKMLKDALDYTVMSCVNAVGVELNTASEQLLSYVSGIGPSLARKIVDYRNEHGAFASREALKAVPRLGAKAFEQSAGFLRIRGGNNPLDNTGIHPESYGVVKKIAAKLGVKVEDLFMSPSLQDANFDGIAGAETLADIVVELQKPGRDIRSEASVGRVENGVQDIAELHEGMELDGTVSNITAFGAFIDLGLKEKGLVHISELANRRVGSVGEVLKLGQQVRARVIGVDLTRKRISLSLKK